MLSPLSWWNDLFVNVPLALAFAWVVSLVYPAAFQASVLVGYWLTNIVGLVLLHKGAQDLLTADPVRYTRKALVFDLCFSLIYTLLIYALVHWKVLQPLPGYFSSK